MSTAADRYRAKLAARAATMQPVLGEAILRAWDEMARQLNPARLAEAIRTGSADAVFGSVLTDDIMNATFANVEELYLNQTLGNVGFFGKELGVGFNVLSPGVLEAARTLDLKLVNELKGDLEGVIRESVTQGLKEGIGPRTIASRIKKDVGLTAKQLQYVDNFENQLKEGSRSALNRSLGRGAFRKPDGSIGYNPRHAGGTGVSKRDMAMLKSRLGSGKELNPKQIDRIVASYKRKLTAWHSETLARTATVDSLKSAQYAATEEAIRQGILDQSLMKSEWVTAGDSKVRDEHVSMNGQVVQFGTPFSNGQIIPGASDYNCRCIKRDFLGREEI